MKAGALVLAAGISRRFGADKRRYFVDGAPLLVSTLARVQAADIQYRVCLRQGEGKLLPELGLAGVESIECPGATRGMGATLADGVRACGDWDGLLVVLADMPWIEPGTYRQVLDALSPDRIAQPFHRGRPGHPVGFGSAYFPALAALDGEHGGREVVRGHRAALLRIPVDDPGIHRDLDRPPRAH